MTFDAVETPQVADYSILSLSRKHMGGKGLTFEVFSKGEGVEDEVFVVEVGESQAGRRMYEVEASACGSIC